MLKYVGKRLLMMIPVLLGVTFIIFSMLYITPGDPARLVLGDSASPEAVEQYREEQGLNDPFLVQYGRYMKNLILHGDLGTSYSMPVFWLGLLLTLLFSVKLGWLPSSGFNTPLHLILPAVSLGAQSVAVITRMTRSSMLEVINMDYIKTARAKGLHEKTVIIRHALGNALIPIITSAGLQFGTLLGGAVLTESIFSIPGIGRLMVDSIKMRDFPTVQGGVLIIALAFSIVNLLVDLLYAFVDPRIKAQYK